MTVFSKILLTGTVLTVSLFATSPILAHGPEITSHRRANSSGRGNSEIFRIGDNGVAPFGKNGLIATTTARFTLLNGSTFSINIPAGTSAAKVAAFTGAVVKARASFKINTPAARKVFLAAVQNAKKKFL